MAFTRALFGSIPAYWPHSQEGIIDVGEGKREVDLCRSKIKAFCKDMKAEQTAWPTLSHEYHYHLAVCIWDDRQLLFCFVLF